MGHSKIKRLAVFLALVFLFPVQAAAVREVVPIGHTAGIRMKSEGVLVVRLDTVQTADGERCPARDAGVREGDIIVSAGGTEVSSNAELQTALKAAQSSASSGVTKRTPCRLRPAQTGQAYTASAFSHATAWPASAR